MKTVSLSGSPRESVGKKDAKKQRRDGMVPCVLYGGKDQVHFVLKELEFNSLVFVSIGSSIINICASIKAASSVFSWS